MLSGSCKKTHLGFVVNSKDERWKVVIDNTMTTRNTMGKLVVHLHYKETILFLGTDERNRFMCWCSGKREREEKQESTEGRKKEGE